MRSFCTQHHLSLYTDLSHCLSFPLLHQLLLNYLSLLLCLSLLQLLLYLYRTQHSTAYTYMYCHDNYVIIGNTPACMTMPRHAYVQQRLNKDMSNTVPTFQEWSFSLFCCRSFSCLSFSAVALLLWSSSPSSLPAATLICSEWASCRHRPIHTTHLIFYHTCPFIHLTQVYTHVCTYMYVH